MIKDYANKVMDYEYNAFMTLMNVSVSKHLFDEHFTVLWANDYFYELIGYTKEEYEALFHNHVDEYYRDDPKSVVLMTKIIMDAYERQEPGYEFECPMHTKSGKVAWIRVTGRFTDEVFQGIPVIYTIYMNITNLKELQQQLGDALEMAEEANRAKSDFLSQMSHDIRTPMNAIIGMTNIAAMHLDDTQKIRDCLKKISYASQHLLGLINDVLDMSKIESGNIALRPENMSLPDVVENVVSIMQPIIKERGQHFSVHLQKIRHEDFFGDALRLRQILINVLSNASKFTPQNGTITFEIEECSVEKPGYALLQFVCSDTGIGMKPEFLPHIFDSFMRERDSRVDKAEGSGLGLTITKKLTELFGGSISVKSRLGEGTTFWIKLPLKIAPASVCETDCAGKKILVVNHDEILGRYLVQTLEELGVNALWSCSGADAVQKVIQAHQSGEVFDMVLLDWEMPDLDGLNGINGIDGIGGVDVIKTARAIRSCRNKRPPVLLATAYDWSDIENEALQAGIDGFLQKPLFKSTLCHGILRYIGRQQFEVTQKKRYFLEGERVLVAEDNPLNREIALELLRDMGAAVETVEDGAAAVERFGQSEQGYYDLILMDIQMPNVNGYEAARQIRAMPRQDAGVIPIIALTAEAFAENVEMAKEAGMNSHLSKPFDVNSLIQELHKYL